VITSPGHRRVSSLKVEPTSGESRAAWWRREHLLSIRAAL